MNETNKTRLAYNFLNTCQICNNDIEYPILGDFAYGETIFQTEDAKDFCVAVLIDNSTFNFITEKLEQHTALKIKDIHPQKILALLADTYNGKAYATAYPLCPLCKSRQTTLSDSTRTTNCEMEYVTWNDFESLTQEEKLERLEAAINSCTTI